MKRILLVVESNGHAKCMLEKAMLFSPDYIHLLLFSQLEKENQVDGIQAIVDSVTKNQCDTEILVDSSKGEKKKAEKINQFLEEVSSEMVFLHRPQLGKEPLNLTFIKSVLRGANHVSILLCSDKPWKLKKKIVSTVDITDESKQQVALNEHVFRLGIETSKQLSAEHEVLSVIPISRVSQELDIVEPSEVLVKKEKETKRKLVSFIEKIIGTTQIKSHIVAGLPEDKISSTAKKASASLIVLGNVGRTGIEGLLIGNTAEKILTRLTVDAILTKP